VNELRARLRRDESGVTLVELLVAVVFGGIIIAITLSFFTAVMRNSKQSVDTRMSTADAGNVSNVISTSIRSSVGYAKNGLDTLQTPVLPGSGGQAIVLVSYTDAYADLDASTTNAPPYLIRYSVDSQRRMLEERWKLSYDSAGFLQLPFLPDGKTLPATDLKRLLGDVVMNTPTQQLFTYYSGQCGEDELASITTSAADRDKVAFIRFHLRIQSFDSQQTVDLDSTIGLPNRGITTDPERTCAIPAP
jgi:hypothetical protein